MRQGEDKEALATFREANELDPSLKLVPEAEIAWEQGREYVQQGRIDEAIAHLHEALKLDPSRQLAEPELARALKVRASTAFSQKADYNKVLTIPAPGGRI